MIQLAARLLTRYSHVNWALADQAVVSGVNFLTGIFLARYLGLAEFGRYTLAWIAVLFVISINHAMINSPMMSIGPQQSDTESAGYFGAVVVQQLCLAGLAFILLFFGVRLSGMFFPEWRVEALALPLACVALAWQLQDFLRRYFFTRKRAVEAFANDAVAYLGRLAGLAWLFWWYRSNDIADVLWIITASFAVATAVGAPGLRGLDWRAQHWLTAAKRNWRFARWLVGSVVVQWVAGNIFMIAAAGLIGTAAVGGFRAAQNIVGVINILTLGLENAVPPQASRHFYADGYRALWAYLRKVAWLGGGLTLGIALLIAAFPEFLITLVFGTDYLAYVDILRWIALVRPIYFLSIPLRAGLRTIEETRPLFLCSLLAAFLSLATAFAVVGHFGLHSVIFGPLIIHVMMQALLWRAFIRGARGARG